MTTILFWKEVWLGQVSLKDSYPDLFSIGSNQKETVNDHWSQGWNLHFRINLNDWDMERVARLLADIEASTGLTNVADTIKWRKTMVVFYLSTGLTIELSGMVLKVI